MPPPLTLLVGVKREHCWKNFRLDPLDFTLQTARRGVGGNGLHKRPSGWTALDLLQTTVRGEAKPTQEGIDGFASAVQARVVARITRAGSCDEAGAVVIVAVRSGPGYCVGQGQAQLNFPPVQMGVPRVLPNLERRLGREPGMAAHAAIALVLRIQRRQVLIEGPVPVCCCGPPEGVQLHKPPV